MKVRTNLQRILLGLLAIMPLVDTLNGMGLRSGDGMAGLNIGQIYRMIVMCLLLLLISSVEKAKAAVLLLLFTVFMVTQLCMPVLYNMENAKRCLKLFMPIFMMYVLDGLVEKNKVTFSSICKVIEAIFWIAPFTIIVPYVFRIGYRTYDDLAGYVGFYFAANEISFVISSCIMFSCIKLVRKGSLKYFILLVINMLSALLLGTKSSLAVGGMCIFLYVCSLLFGKENDRTKKLFVTMAMLAAIAIGISVFSDNLHSIYIRLLYARQQHADESIMYFLTSGRTGRIKDAWHEFNGGSAFRILFGWGLGGAGNGMPSIEMDFFDLLFSTGCLGCLAIMGLYFLFLKQMKLEFWSVIFLMLLCTLIFVGGHVLYAGLGGMMNALLLVYIVQYSRIQRKESCKHCRQSTGHS